MNKTIYYVWFWLCTYASTMSSITILFYSLPDQGHVYVKYQEIQKHSSSKYKKKDVNSAHGVKPWIKKLCCAIINFKLRAIIIPWVNHQVDLKRLKVYSLLSFKQKIVFKQEWISVDEHQYLRFNSKMLSRFFNKGVYNQSMNTRSLLSDNTLSSYSFYSLMLFF